MRGVEVSRGRGNGVREGVGGKEEKFVEVGGRIDEKINFNFCYLILCVVLILQNSEYSKNKIPCHHLLPLFLLFLVLSFLVPVNRHWRPENTGEKKEIEEGVKNDKVKKVKRKKRKKRKEIMRKKKEEEKVGGDERLEHDREKKRLKLTRKKMQARTHHSQYGRVDRRT